jgi:PIN domain nuclease of toxin-antitoxin system
LGNGQVILLDTHVWLWWCNESPYLSQRARRAIDDARTLFVSAISSFEIAAAVEKGRIQLDRDVLMWLRVAMARPLVEIVPISLDVAVTAARLRGMHGDPADRLILASAQELNVPLVTKDRRLRKHSEVTSIW